MNSFTPLDWDRLQQWMCGEAYRLVGHPEEPESSAYSAMLHQPNLIRKWGDGAFEQSEADQAQIDAAARAFAHEQPLPPLTIEQRGRLALRLRLASRIARALSSRHSKPPKGWFPNHLSKMPEPDIVEWLLVDAWPFVGEICDESLSWADGVQPPPAPSHKLPPPPASSAEANGFSE